MKLSRFSQNVVVYYWYFRVKDIHFVSLHTAQKVYKPVSCLLLSKSFPAQRYLHNVRQTIFGTFLSCCCAIFEQANDWLVAWCLISPVIMFSLMFRQHRHLLTQTQHSGVVIEHVSACWVARCQHFCYCSVVCVILSVLQDLTTIYIFFVLALNVNDVISLCKDIC